MSTPEAGAGEGTEPSHEVPAPSQSATLRYIPGLDGIRGLAVLAVIFHHSGVSIGYGGYVGVDVFFVLSGFLITRILMRRFEKEHRVPFRHFYERRARRILPALWTMFLVLTVFTFVDPKFSTPDEYFHSVGIAAVFLTQWQVMMDDLPGPFVHLWSLGWEENFYLLWPVMFALAGRRAKVILSTLLVAGMVTLNVMRIINFFNGSSSPWGLWVAATFRVDAIMLGCLLGLLLAYRPVEKSSRFLKVELWVAFAALFGLLIMFRFASERFYLAGGFTLVAFSTAIMVNHLRRRTGSALARVLEIGFLRWTGLISYGLYLWHYPVFHWMRVHEYSAWTKLLVGAPISIGIAALSYYTVEAWFRKT